MDLKDFYKSIRGIEAGIEEAFPLIVSFAATNGGKAGVIAEVSRYNAARNIVEGRARLATPEEAEEYRAGVARERMAIQQEEARHRLSVTVISADDLREIKGAAGPKEVR